ncbi:hypothetical protein J437_LFUL001840 [Ladona fulva]|uniref:MADF domain-containing protein n=1 Tax=Ladona fulva TaxID=123851 RepID=A0A8K0JXY9_LADFU|nr:hypothetical protein J437_LFUL001840 [Ladona fulva]
MRDDQDFNIKFVQLVQQHPCLYDQSMPNYYRTRAQDQAWRVIANEIKENGTVRYFTSNCTKAALTAPLPSLQRSSIDNHKEE